MKFLNEYTDLFSICAGSGAALLKALKLKLPKRSIFLSMCVAGVIAYGAIGLLTIYFKEMSPKVLVLSSFSIGWVANELTAKLDAFVNDAYDIFINRIKSIFTKK